MQLAHAQEALPSWNDGPSRRAILRFVGAVTDEQGPSYVRPDDRIAVFDNDGTLWSEQPLYIQLQFALDRVRALAPEHPEWQHEAPFRQVLEHEDRALAHMSEHDAAALLAATHGGMTVEEFDRVAREWFATASHPRFERPYERCLYRPMLELLGYLRASRFRTYIVSGGGVDFMRAVARRAYGIPPAQVIGSSAKTRFEQRDGQAALVKLPEISSIDDRDGKPINIHLHIGQRPILAFGNSDGDLQMLEYTDAGPAPHLALLLHHNDARREYSYDREAAVGRLDAALERAAERGWTVVSMKTEWNRVFVPLFGC